MRPRTKAVSVVATTRPFPNLSQEIRPTRPG
jgi:hypothetical protein